MTETKTRYTVEVSLDTMKLDSLTRDYIIGHARRDAQRLEAGETLVDEITGKTTKLVMDEEAVQSKSTMTVAELIAKLQEMPQDMMVYGHDGEEGPYRLCNASVQSVLDGDDKEYVTERGYRYTRVDPDTLRRFNAVVIS